ncbi:Rad52/Rad22 family DNA repair protein, partial [uncultured Oscillibacter sp.]|uniref:Rad52/Rad22 family DNA repair protein n=1 Tax=uncultured Oscillibacter sp. TaxID=876091 RepID=UPI0025DB6167
MAQKDARTIQAELAKPFAAEDLEWRLQKTFEAQGRMTGIAVPYVTNRAIMNRLDSVVGPENWYNDFKPWHAAGKKEAQICGISIHFEGRGFITKWDGAEDSD